MAFKINKIFFWDIYQKSYKEIVFSNTKVNYIFGENSTGKTALMYIIDYCLGASKCQILKESIQDYVSFFGICLNLGKNKNLLIYRKSPSFQSNDKYRIFIKEMNSNCNDINLNDLVQVSLESLKGILYKLCFKQNITLQTEFGNIQFREIVKFCFQPHYILTNPNEFFYASNNSSISKNKITMLLPILTNIDDAKTLEYMLKHKEVTKSKNEVAVIGKTLKSLQSQINSKYDELFDSLKELDIKKFIPQSLKLLDEFDKQDFTELNYVNLKKFIQKLETKQEEIYLNINLILDEETTDTSKLKNSFLDLKNLQSDLKDLNFLYGKLFETISNNEITYLLNDYRTKYKGLLTIEKSFNKNNSNYSRNKSEEEINFTLENYINFLGTDIKDGRLKFTFKDCKLTYENNNKNNSLSLETVPAVEWTKHHVALILSLHELFMNNTIIQTPNFIIFDSPSLIFQNNKDTTEIERLYMILDIFKKNTNNKIQIIILDNYKLENTDFINNKISLTKEKPLIPKDWKKYET